MKHSVIVRSAIIAGIALGAFAISALADWQAPLSAPPTCATNNPGCDAPINVGSATQYKNGPLGLGALSGLPGSTLLDVFGTGVINDLWTNTFHVTGSGQTLGKGKVLTDVNGDGNATWQTPTTGSGSGSTGLTGPVINFMNNPTQGYANIGTPSDTASYSSYSITNSGVPSTAKAVLLWVVWTAGYCGNCSGTVYAQAQSSNGTWALPLISQVAPGGNTSNPQVGVQSWVPVINGKIYLRESTSNGIGGIEANAYTVWIIGYSY